MPPLNADERTTLESWLEFRRATLATKCEGLDADPDGPDGGFDLAQGATLSGALAVWRAEIASARELCAARERIDGTAGV